MQTAIRPTIMIFILLTAVTGVLYPLAVTGIAQLIFAEKANGSLLASNNNFVGSNLIGQFFDDSKFLWGRPSAASPEPYNASSSSGSNKGPTNPELKKAIAERIDKLRAAEPGNIKTIPVDLVTASGSGLDPHISPEAADFQTERIAHARGIEMAKVRDAIHRCTEQRQLGFLGDPRVNVLCVNLCLEGIISLK